MRGIQYAAAFRPKRDRLWNTGSPGHPRSSRGQAPGDDHPSGWTIGVAVWNL